MDMTISLIRKEKCMGTFHSFFSFIFYIFYICLRAFSIRLNYKIQESQFIIRFDAYQIGTRSIA